MQRLWEQIDEACKSVGRSIEEVKIVAVAKGVGVEKVQEVLECGIKDIGENRVQEAKRKYKELKECVQLHMVGHLQRNKAKDAVHLFNLLQSLDSVELASTLNACAERVGKVFDVLLQVKIEEGSLHGFLEEEVEDVLEQLSSFKYLRILGIMTMAPLVEPEYTRRYFRKARALFEKLPSSSNFHPRYLSMGMSNDLTVAVQEGANMVRVGRAIFGE